jgi:hypothetical protein
MLNKKRVYEDGEEDKEENSSRKSTERDIFVINRKDSMVEHKPHCKCFYLPLTLTL